MKTSNGFIRGIAIGIIATTILTNFTFANSYQKQIQAVYNNIKIVVKGQEVISEEEPFIVNGRTYVPLRGIAEMLGEKVEWDADNNTVVIGEEKVISKKPGKIGIAEGIITPFKRMKYSYNSFGPDYEFVKTEDVFVATNETKDAQDHVYARQKKYDLENALYQIATHGKVGQTYILNGDYTKMTAYFFVDDSMRADSEGHYSTVSFYGNGYLLGEYTAKRGEVPQAIEIDLIGIDDFQIIINDRVTSSASYYLGEFNGILNNLTFEEIQKIN